MRNKCIGVFDSGFGGLTVLRGIRELLPDYDYLYLGDTARAPYGSRSQEEIYNFTEQAVRFFFEKECELVILACNTTSSEALRKIQQEYLPKNYSEKRVLGVLIPACEEAIAAGHKKIGVMATESTVASNSYVRELKKLNHKIEIMQVACPELVPIIESGDLSSETLDDALDKHLIVFDGVDAVILGCTHYEIIKDKIEQRLGNARVIAQSAVVAQKLADYLSRHIEMENRLAKNGTLLIHTTDNAKGFVKLSTQIMGEPVRVRRVRID